MKFRTKSQVCDGSKKQDLQIFKLSLSSKIISRLRMIAIENDTFASEVVRQIVTDFVTNYDKEKEESNVQK